MKMPRVCAASSTRREENLSPAGITFNVYGRAEAAERLIPFDIIPRIISGAGMEPAGPGH